MVPRHTWVLILALTLTNPEQGMTLEQVGVELRPSVGTIESATWGVTNGKTWGKPRARDLALGERAPTSKSGGWTHVGN